MPQSKVVREIDKILQAAAHEALHLVGARVGSDELGMRLVMGEQSVLIGRQPEEIALLLDPLDRRPLRRQFLAVVRGLLELALVVIGLVAHRVPAGIFVEIDVAVLLHAPPQLLASALMPLLAGADEIVVGAVERGDHVAETWRVAVGKLCRGDALLLRRLQHLDAMLVGAGQEKHVHALQAAEAR